MNKKESYLKTELVQVFLRLCGLMWDVRCHCSGLQEAVT